MLGFLVSATARTHSTSPRRICFNPVLGFLVSATACRGDDSADDDPVSIPCWVFWSLRPTDRYLCPIVRNGFNPVLGFLVSATSLSPSSIPTFWCFNPVLGFLVSATSRPRSPCRPRSRVSIPCWVFWSLRLPARPSVASGVAKFQSRAGFSGLCDTTRDRAAISAPSSFQSRAGFSGLCDETLTGVSVVDVVFQSRAGFSGLCDSCSIPGVVVFLFQSRAGFSGLCDNANSGRSRAPRKFQSRAGFSGLCDVSVVDRRYAPLSFQSRAGFSGLCDRRRPPA